MTIVPLSERYSNFIEDDGIVEVTVIRLAAIAISIFFGVTET
jgi:hypothetical protein